MLFKEKVDDARTHTRKSSAHHKSSP